MLKDKKILNVKKTLFERILISLQMFKSSRFRFIKSILPVYHKLPVLLFKILIYIYIA